MYDKNIRGFAYELALDHLDSLLAALAHVVVDGLALDEMVQAFVDVSYAFYGQRKIVEQFQTGFHLAAGLADELGAQISTENVS